MDNIEIKLLQTLLDIEGLEVDLYMEEEENAPRETLDNIREQIEKQRAVLREQCELYITTSL